MLERAGASYRDPSGHVYEHDGRIFRSVSRAAVPDYEAVRDAGVFRDLAAAGKLVGLEEVDRAAFGDQAADFAHLLEHPRLPFISHPYEWSFSLLRDAALFHLDLHLELLERGFTLTDASAYNVQFVGPDPVFVDHLSIRPYRDGEYWLAHRQFCEQFLNGLLLRALFGVPHNAWYRGAQEGVPVDDLARLLRLRHRFSWRLLTHVVLPNRLQERARQKGEPRRPARPLPLAGYRAMLSQLRSWIAALSQHRIGRTTWADYAEDNTYDRREAGRKRQFVARFVEEARPELLVDLGCNTGDYAKLALESGARRTIGFDSDQAALDRAHQRAKQEALDFLPLFLDARNPSPDQGWRQAERSGFATRVRADAVLALAFEHHLAIAHNIPLDQAIEWITEIAPGGVIEFVPKSDPTIQKMLALREDVFPDYSLDCFAQLLAARRRIVRQETVSETGRTLFAFTS